MRELVALTFILLILSTIGNLTVAQDTNHWESIFYSNSIFKYYTSSEGIVAPDWRNIGFVDDSWRSGPGGIGFGDDDDGTTIEGCVSLAIRKSFS